MDLPYSLEAEKQVLANMLSSKEILVETATRLKEDDFYDEKHKIIFSTLIKMLEQNKAKIEPSALIDTLDIDNNLEKAGDAEYIIEIFDNYIDTANNRYYVDSIEERSILRQIILYSSNIVNKWQSDSAGDIVEYINKIEKNITDITKKRKIEDFVSIEKALEFYKNKTADIKAGKITNIGIPSGISSLDKMTMGFHPGDLIILAARPSVGKSALALNMLVHAAKATKKNCVMFSLEMGVDSLTNRMLALSSQVDSRSIQLGNFDKNQELRVSKAIRDLQESPIYIDETAGIKVMDMRAKLQKLQAAHGEIGFIVVDYIGLISPDTKSKESNRSLEIGKISSALKGLARDFKTPILVLSQLNREADRPNTKPRLSNLRESGNIEQDADIVLFIHRDDYGSTEKSEENSVADSISQTKLIVAKHRNGETGEIDLYFHKNYGRFYEIDTKNSASINN